ncbi:MAG: nickel-dependent lactate racemase [Actinomycetota bacterium]|nr:nickel-dependent lactate racemase [Actinomycetota bacterium]
MLEVDERTPPLLVHSGESFGLERFPLGTRVIYPPEPLPGLPDVRAAIADALEHPIDSEPLRELLRPGMRLTLAFDDISLPLPPMRTPDIRQQVLEQVLELAAAAGVDDVELVVANALHRRMTGPEIRRIVGERVFRSFWPHALTNHDAEDRDNLEHLGLTDLGEDVEINKRAATSDLLVYVNVNLVAMDGGWKSSAIGLASYASLRHHHNSRTMRHSRSFMDSRHSELHSSAWRMGRLLQQHVRVFQIETTLNNQCFPKAYGFLTKREWEWSARDQATYWAVKQGLDRLPAPLRRKVFRDVVADYEVTSVQAGAVEPVHERTLAHVHRQQLVEVQGQTDVLVFGLPYLSPYNVNSSVMNPVLAMCLGLGYFFNMYRGRPLVRPGGALILHHPVHHAFDQLHHPSYVDFFEEVLAESTDPAVIEERFEKQYATDPWYAHLYRTSNAYHGVHPFYMWYWGAHALDHVGDVVFVGGDRRAVERMGFRSASTMADALELVSGTVGRNPTITYQHNPPHSLADVR